MRYNCKACGKEVSPFAEYWLREPDRFNQDGVAVERGELMPFCSLKCIFSWVGKRIQRERKDFAKIREVQVLVKAEK